MVYKMLIAEDEREEYELAVFLLNKLKLDSCLQIYYAENGKQAMKILDETSIDLLLTDVEMPFANGLKIAAKARAGNPSLPIIFFSCYDSFSYIKTALSVQANNYLLKPLDPDEFEQTMRHTFKLLHQAGVQREHRESRIQALRNHYLYLKLNRMPCEHLPVMEGGISFSDDYSRLLLLHFEEAFFDCEPKLSEAFTGLLHALLPCSFDFVNLNSSQSVLLFQGETGYSTEKLANLCRIVHDKILKAYQMKCFMAVSPPLAKSADLPGAYEDACSLLENRFFCQDRYVFHAHSRKIPVSGSYDLRSAILNSVKADLETGNMEKLTEDVMRLNQFFEQAGNYSHIYVRYIYAGLIQTLYGNTECDELTEDIERVFSCSFIHEIEQIVFTVLAKLQAEQRGISPSRKHVIQLARQYIHRHYREQISLNELAGAVYLNPSYLSTVFKVETGSSVNKYIKAVRMEKAKQLLTETNIKVGDAGAAVGFSNTSYFIRSFHEYYGETPDKLRQK